MLPTRPIGYGKTSEHLRTKKKKREKNLKTERKKARRKEGRKEEGEKKTAGVIIASYKQCSVWHQH